MSRYISENLRQMVIERADFRCEYCKINSAYSYFTFHIEHIVSIKHGGETVSENLAYACSLCNIKKGSDVATFINNISNPIRFFNPRTDHWRDHFIIENTGLIGANSSIAEATIKILHLNHPDSIIERREMIRLSLFK